MWGYDGSWWLVVGCWPLVVGSWQLVGASDELAPFLFVADESERNDTDV